MSHQNDDLAYGGYYDSSRGSGDTSRGFGDTFKKLRDTYKSHSSSSQAQPSGQSGQPYNQTSNQPASQGQQQTYQNQNQPPQQYGYSSQAPDSQYQQSGKPQKQDKFSGFLGKIQGTVAEYGNEWATKVGNVVDPQAYAQYGQTQATTQHRFDSFAPPREHNDVKWYVDGCSYFWAVSRALENARESIWILDWWLSPELYLRRPPAKNENYRLDRMLQAAAQRGVRVNIIVYKEVTQAATLSSAHTKHALEALHPNIAVFRHPDHLPNGHEVASEIESAFQHLTLNSTNLTQMSKENLNRVYGATDEATLFWSHHEKLCLIDGRTAFMGGLDLCFGRWDTHQHAIADVHPEDLNETVFPGQDYNNSRVLDFHNVAEWEKNQLDRRVSSRMGWSDISISMHGPVVEDLRRHFLERWNFIYDAKYQTRNNSRYARLALYGQAAPPTGQQQQQQQQQQQGGTQQGNLYPSGQASPQTQQPPQQNLSSQFGAAAQTSSQNQQSQPSWQAVIAHPSAPQSSASPHPQQQQQTQAQYQPGSYPPHPSQTPVQSQTPQSQAPSWQAGVASQTVNQSPVSPQPQQQQQQAHAQTPYQQHQPSTYPPAPSQASGHSDYQQTPTSTQSWPSEKADYPHPGQSHTPSNTQSPPPYSSAVPGQDHGSHQYSYTGDSFPPPPPGPVPTQSSGNTSYSPQPQGQQSQQPQQAHGSYYPPPQSNVSELPAQENYHPQAQAQPQPQTQSSYYQQQPTQSSTDASQTHAQGSYYPPPPSQESQSATRGIGDQQYEGQRGFVPKRFEEKFYSYVNPLRGQLAGQIHQYQDRLTNYGQPAMQSQGQMSCQIVRSCAKWSNGSPLEHSIATAYAAVIKNSQHFIYIENQFFITATGDHQHPVKNTIGAAIVERILRAARAGEKFKIIVVIPSVPSFAGDLHDDSALSTRAIMEFQYNSINRGGNSIMELIAKEGFNPMDYIRFYNLRNYDRINNGNIMATAEQQSGVNYGDASHQYEQHATAPVQQAPQGPTRTAFDPTAPFDQYQQAAQHAPANKVAGARRWDSVSSCYMLGGEDIRNVPWNGHPDAEIDAFVSEELYVHSKVMIADDRVVICGSANLNDRSQLGDHDSEIAVIIEDFTPLQSTMNGKPWTASRFASSLRRELMRKHLGLLPPQDYQKPDSSFEPVGVPIQFDFDCPESRIVADPLSDGMQSLWNSRARNNTEVFRKVFHAVPDDSVRNWATYKEFYEYYFHDADKEAEGKEGFYRPARFQWGHVVRDDFPHGPEGAKQVKELLSQVKGTLVEMPLMFLGEEDIAKTGLTLNELTEPIFT
ncbi:uncharacterized protein N7483_002120 [Penicillium malachiteum]|uniref:uncharacterized protein n=1 Tax=Penicillium malachiteum TaxID=1324776 RepID=UPI0025473990|nr:uncharacterized protein N7483_002120 [Penicillium malachiteum]KAJ5736995.1 hypothetical protein N7483_002120 [Penicillium malachiteum]